MIEEGLGTDSTLLSRNRYAEAAPVECVFGAGSWDGVAVKRPIMNIRLAFLSVVAITASVLATLLAAQDSAPKPVPPKAKGKARVAAPKAKAKKKAPALLATAALKGEPLVLRDEKLQRDFSAAGADGDGTIWIAYLENDAEAHEQANADTLWLAKQTDARIEPVAAISEPGIIHQPAIAVDGEGTIWCAWGQTGSDDVMHLMARPVADGEPGKIVNLAESAGSESFADAGTDQAGRVWVTWQSMRAGEGDIFARYFDPKEGEWSDEIAVATDKGGDWEPRIAFDGIGGDAWIIYDSSRGNEFNLYLARVTLDGSVETKPIAHTPRYEARADLCASADGEGFWIAAERGRIRWGLDVRGHGNDKGINAQKEVLFGYFDVKSGEFTEIPPGPAAEAGNPVNLPTVGLDAGGDPWVAYRYFERIFWRIAITEYDQDSKTWRARRRLENSTFGQDRRSHFVSDAKGGLWFSWPTDLRKTKRSEVSGIHLAQIDTDAEFLPAKAPGEPRDYSNEPFAASQSTPERPADERHHWEHDGKKYGLYWGDFHRHTDVSNCRTGFDGCIVENFRYAYDIAKLDFLGTSDHTDVGKFYHPYEWWHNQRLHDVLHAPGQFNSMYVYEREQRWPWGHRNVVFAQRGGPIVYIKRRLYRESPWQKLYPVEANPLKTEIEPPELWKILRKYGEPVAVISHTGATGMGTDWGRYDESGIDNGIESLVEIYQGARVSYEGIGAPQPTVGLRPKEKYTSASGAKNEPMPPEPITDFGKHNAGVYQNALALGHRLGVFASSDHISQHVTYGGVYVEEFTREGLIAAFRERRTVGATDKIYLEFSCNEKPLGSIFSTDEKPTLTMSVDGTAPLKRVTIVRNEENWKVFDQIDGNTFEVTHTDEAPPEGEGRYYIRVEQKDGNMAWSSPVWVTYQPK